MADETSATPQQAAQQTDRAGTERDRAGTERAGGRPGGNREGGGFRIRLSDNEMRAARALQDAFRLRSTVAVLGFAVRTLAQLLEEGKLDELVAQQQSQPAREGRAAPRGRRDGDSRGGRGGERGGERGPRIDPFARPAKPASARPEAEAGPETLAEPDSSEPTAVEAPAADEAAVSTATEG